MDEDQEEAVNDEYIWPSVETDDDDGTFLV
jgi:hypothetical protein